MMKLFTYWRKTMSLRGHLRLYMLAMLLLMCAFGAASFFSLQSTINSFEAVIQREFIEMHRLVYLQVTTRESTTPIYHYIIGHDPREVEKYNEISAEVDQAFTDALALSSFDTEQWGLLLRAQGEWQEAKRIGDLLFSRQISSADTGLADAVRLIDVHVSNVVDTLYEAHNVRVQNVEARKQKATERYHLIRIITLASFIGGLAIILLATITMARYIMKPIGVLRDGIARFGQGDLAHRITLDSDNELGELAQGFNNMANRLEQDQIALEKLAIRDGLTDLYNRRKLDQILTEELHRSQRYRHPLCLLLVDIDGFKTINDTYGHRAGDETLRHIAAIVREINRQGDTVARYGGDEIAILFPETPPDDAVGLAERICRSISSQPLRLTQETVIKTTVSIGVAAAPHDATTHEQLFAVADGALYAAKRGVRNCVRRAVSGIAQHNPVASGK